MPSAIPSDPFVVSFDDLPVGLVGSGTPIGVQIRRASNGTVVSGRTTSGIVEEPVASGTYEVTGTAPAELGEYLVLVDWNAGVIESDTSEARELTVAVSIPLVISEFGLVADATKSHMGETFDGLVSSEHYGSGYVMRKIDVIKQRVLNSPPDVEDEDTLHKLVIDYLGKLAAIDLMPAAIDYWARQAQTDSTGSDPTETVSYPDRLEAMKQLQEELLRQTRRDEIVVTPLLEDPRTRDAVLVGPAIDEVDDCKVTAEPRFFPRYDDFPFSSREDGRVS